MKKILPALLSVATLAAQRERQFKETVYFPPAGNPTWPLSAEDPKYAAIDARWMLARLKQIGAEVHITDDVNKLSLKELTE